MAKIFVHDPTLDRVLAAGVWWPTIFPTLLSSSGFLKLLQQSITQQPQLPNCDRSHCQTYSLREKHERLKIEKKGRRAPVNIPTFFARRGAPKIEAFHVVVLLKIKESKEIPEIGVKLLLYLWDGCQSLLLSKSHQLGKQLSNLSFGTYGYLSDLICQEKSGSPFGSTSTFGLSIRKGRAELSSSDQ